jgi:hypothetical protein
MFEVYILYPETVGEMAEKFNKHKETYMFLLAVH